MKVESIALNSGWEIKPLEQVAEILDSVRVPINNTERAARIAGKHESELYPYYGATGQVGVIDGYLFDGEYVLLGEDGAPFLDPVKSKAYLVSGKFWVNNHAHILRAKSSNRFLCHYLNHISYEGHVTGTTRLKLTQGALKKIPVALPSGEVQDEIVAKIETLFSELEKGIESLKTARQQLKAYRQAVLKHAFEGKLTEQWRQQNPDKLESPQQLLARVQQEREQRYQKRFGEWKQAVKAWEDNGKEGRKPGKPKKLAELKNITEIDCADLPALPTGWCYVRLGALMDEPTYGTSAKCDYESGEKSVLRIPNVINGFVDDADLKFASFEAVEIDHLRLEEGDILTIRSNGSVSLVGSCALIRKKDEKHIFAGYLIRLRPNNNLIFSAFLLSVLSSHLLRKQIESVAKSTSGVNNINSAELQNLIIPLPSKDEQAELISYLEVKTPSIEVIDKEISEQLIKSEILRQSILKKAFSGQLIVDGYDIKTYVGRTTKSSQGALYVHSK